ncbi:MAG: ABC transporter ATP-binding protein [Planctomycetota bacterium]|nr:ABC transporter ATP-binding protein [Planctomycetota bacterium]
MSSYRSVSLTGRNENTIDKPANAANSENSVVECRGVGIRYRLKKEGGESFKARLRRILRRETSQDFWALKNFNLSVNEGQILGVVGRNGAGKSTLCQLLSGILVPDEGTLRVQGRVTSLLGVGIGFQEDLTGRDNTYLSGAFFGFPEAHMTALLPEIQAFADIGDFFDVPIKKWSSGMRARLGFAIGVHTSGDILILDEVLAVGDEAFQEKCRDRLQTLMDKAKAIIMVSHNSSLLERLATDMIWLDRGGIRASGSPAEVLAAYRAG